MLSRERIPALILWAVAICLAVIVGTRIFHPAPSFQHVYPLPNQFSTISTLENALDAEFRSGHRQYRIAPTVTNSGGSVVIDERKFSTFEDSLTALLASARNQESPLTYRIEKGVYVIEPKGSAATKEEIVFPSIPEERAARSEYVLENRPIGEALRLILDKTGEDYMLGVPDSGKTVTLHLKNATIYEAMQAALRAAEIPRHFQVVKQRGVYGISPRRTDLSLSDAELKSWKFSARFRGVPAWDAFSIGFALLGNYTLDKNLKVQKVLITANFRDRSYDEMLSGLARGASSEIRIVYKERQLRVRALQGLYAD